MRRVLLLIAVAVLAFGSAHAFTLTVATEADAVILNPQDSNDLPGAKVNRQIYDTLLVSTEELDLEPGLAESWAKIDDLTWEFYLRPGVVFHNGDPLTSRDVVFTFDRLRDAEVAAPAAFIVGFVDGVEAVDELTVRITTKAPYGVSI